MPRLVPLLLCFTCSAQASVVHEYTVTVAEDLETLWVEARFAHPVSDMRARANGADEYLGNARDCASGETLSVRGRRLALPSDGVDCVRYEVDLGRAAAAERRNANLAPDNVIVSPTVWLWHPPLSSRARVRVSFDLPPDSKVSVPWRPVDGRDQTYEVMPSPRNARAPAAFGHFIESRRELPGSTLRIALLRPDRRMDSDAILDWVRETAHDVSLAYGRFPNPSPQVVVVPVGRSGWQSDSPVPFGRVLRDGGESVELFINERSPIDDFYDDWTATHEFSHLMLPYLRSSHRWISEGFAQYYQNVLMARAGRYDAQRAWQKLYEGFERGRRSRPELSPNEAARQGVGAATMKIYWSGAIIALMADVELRQRSGGRESLDSVLDELQRCCLPSARGWRGTELFEKLDSFLDEPVFMPLYRRYANQRGFPDIRPVFERLGLDIERGRIVFRDDAELSAVRREITEIY